MLRLMGAILVLIGGFFVGYLKSQELKGKVEVTTDFLEALSYMKREILQNRGYMFEIMEKLGEKDYSTVGRYFHKMVEQRESEANFSEKWRESIQYEEEISEEIRGILEPLGDVLGQYDGESQGEAIGGIVDSLRGLREEQLEESGRMGRVYVTLGVVGGLFLVILLL